MTLDHTDTPRPGAAHAKLARLAGTWRGKETLHPSPWAPEASQCESTLTARIAIDGFFLISDYEQRAGGDVTFRGHGVYGFDAQTQKYTMHWFDSTGVDPGAPATGTWIGDTLTFEHRSPMGHGRYVYTCNEDGSYTFQMSHSMDGQRWAPTMDATFTRTR